MLLAFDAPVPFSSMGRRNVSNVAAQALALLNDPLVLGQARLWAEGALARPARSDRDRFDELYLAALGRLPSQSESSAALAFLGTDREAARDGVDRSARHEARASAWADLCHVLINMKEFIFIE
jgi:hypothetical protein